MFGISFCRHLDSTLILVLFQLEILGKQHSIYFKSAFSFLSDAFVWFSCCIGNDKSFNVGEVVGPDTTGYYSPSLIHKYKKA